MKEVTESVSASVLGWNLCMNQTTVNATCNNELSVVSHLTEPLQTLRLSQVFIFFHLCDVTQRAGPYMVIHGHAKLP